MARVDDIRGGISAIVCMGVGVSKTQTFVSKLHGVKKKMMRTCKLTLPSLSRSSISKHSLALLFSRKYSTSSSST